MGTAADALEKTGVTVRDAGDDDAVAGVRPRWVALPESAEEVAALMRASAEQDLAVVPVGGGTKLHWGLPPERCDLLIDTCCLTAPAEHAAGDMVVRVAAGTTMEELAALLARNGQELALDVPLEGATVGGTLATATAGPRRFRYGTARDLLIGITVVLADGTVARSGGKVVKNVAGYDLGKLFTGSYGTLGVIAEATFRLHPIPAARRWVTAAVAPGRLAAHSLALAASQAEPSAIELDWPAGGPATLSVLVEGAAADGRARTVLDLIGEGRIEDEPPPWWGRLPGGEGGEGDWSDGSDGSDRSDGSYESVAEALVELRVPPSRAADALAALPRPAETSVRGALASGVLLLAPPPGAALPAYVTALRAAVREHGARAVVLAAPDPAALDMWGETGALPLLRRVKERFDPGRRMSPGRFVGGI